MEWGFIVPKRDRETCWENTTAEGKSPIYNGILLNHKKEWNNATGSNMNGPRDYQIKWSKLEKDKYHMSFICGIVKNGTKKWYILTEQK